MITILSTVVSVLDFRLRRRASLELELVALSFSHRLHGMKGGAIEFLTKPFKDQDLLDAVQLGPARDRAPLGSERVPTRICRHAP
jgi:hypothetical protein